MKKTSKNYKKKMKCFATVLESMRLNFNSFSAVLDVASHATGASVRCIKN